MQKEIVITGKGQRADIGDMTIYRVLPNRYVKSVGPFIFLDHLPPQARNQTEEKTGTGAHPHRGIATLSYILQGIDTHYDSAGHYAKVTSGGIQWMKAGNGIIHDETIIADPDTGSGTIHGFQFWINLLRRHKLENPDYMAIQPVEVPTKIFEQQKAWIKVIAGSYEELHANIPGYSEQFIYHIHFTEGGHFSLETNELLEYAIFMARGEALVNDVDFHAGDFIQFASDNGIIAMNNLRTASVDLLVFGGEPYSEPIVAEGPFVMNSHEEIAEAYRDFHLGKYGQIDYK